MSHSLFVCCLRQPIHIRVFHELKWALPPRVIHTILLSVRFVRICIYNWCCAVAVWRERVSLHRSLCALKPAPCRILCCHWNARACNHYGITWHQIFVFLLAFRIHIVIHFNRVGMRVLAYVVEAVCVCVCSALYCWLHGVCIVHMHHHNNHLFSSIKSPDSLKCGTLAFFLSPSLFLSSPDDTDLLADVIVYLLR